MHRGCFVWTPTPPLLGRRTTRPGPARVCVFVPCLVGSGGPASQARSGAPHLSFGRFWCALCLFTPLRAGVAPFVVVFGFFVFSSFSPPRPSLPPRCVLLCVFSGPGCVGPSRLVAPPPFFSPFPPPVRPIVSCLACFPASGALGLGVLLPPPPPCCLWRFLLSGCLGPLPPPLSFSFVSCFFFFCFFFLFFFCRLCGARQVCVSWAVGCARVCLCGAVPVVALCALAGVVWCLLLGLAVLYCLLVGLGVVLWWCCPCLAAWLAALWFGVVCRGVPLACVVFCCAVLSCGAVLSCSAVCLRRCLCLLFVSGRCASAVCVLGCRAVCSLSPPPCAVLCCAVLVPFRCAVRVACAVSGGWCCWFLVSLSFVGGLLVALVARRCRLVVCVGFGARVWSGPRSASSLWCSAPLCCVLWRCAAVWCCAVVPCLLFLFFPLLVALASCCSPLVLGSGPVPGSLCFCALPVPVRCCAGVPASLLSVRCPLALAGLAGVLCCCLLCLCVCCWAWLSSVVSWWVLVAPGVVSRWRAVVCSGCCAAPCYCALCRLALRCCALCCFVLLCLLLPRAVLCSGALFVLGSCAFWRRVLSYPPALFVFCCGVSLRGVVRRCALCRVRPGVSCGAFPVVSALCGVAVWPAIPRCPAPLCCALWFCAAASCRGVPSCRLVGFVSCVGVVVPT